MAGVAAPRRGPGPAKEISGLWTALPAKERDPGRDVVLIEADRIGHAASGRNGGFRAASLTHGFASGPRRWADAALSRRAVTVAGAHHGAWLGGF